jgi:uncharacterized coiled-coil DUF342 family protein
MENLKENTPTQLLKLINETKDNHDRLKQEIIDDTFKMDELEKTINEKINKLDELEKRYVTLIEELNSR